MLYHKTKSLFNIKGEEGVGVKNIKSPYPVNHKKNEILIKLWRCARKNKQGSFDGEKWLDFFMK